jgi:hypothetical protein
MKIEVRVDASMPPGTVGLAPVSWLDAMTIWRVRRILGIDNSQPPVPAQGTVALIHNLGTTP